MPPNMAFSPDLLRLKVSIQVCYVNKLIMFVQVMIGWSKRLVKQTYFFKKVGKRNDWLAK